MQTQISDPIKYQETELFTKIFNDFNPLNTFTKNLRVLNFSVKHLMVLFNAQSNFG